MPERRYNNSDLVGKTRDQLVTLVLRQPDRWPSTFEKFKRGKTNMDTMKKALLEAQFTTELPVEQQESPGPPAGYWLITVEVGPISGGGQSRFLIRDEHRHTLAGAIKKGSKEQNGRGKLPNSHFGVKTNIVMSTKREVRIGSIKFSATRHLTRGTKMMASRIAHHHYKVSNGTFSVLWVATVLKLKLIFRSDTTPLSDNTPVPVPVASQVLPEQRSILLLIEDTRHPVIERYSQRIDVSIIPPNQASSTEILAKLQASISAIEGPARIGIQDDLNPGYIQFFAAISDPTTRWEVEAYGRRHRRHEEARARPESPLDEPPDSTKNSNSQTHSIAPTSKKSRTTSLTEDELAWLSEKARFSAKYYKVPWPAGISLSGGNTVRKAAIETVLGMKSTALTQAENSSRVLAIYYDGTHKSEEGVKRVEETTEGEADTGSGVLYKFLVQWEKDHPVND
ncbi:hypothetical protein B0H16DRAFT_1461788 [Mycena metata]|uniref:Uncharacterized protein n=1 Tax=Mycena metata TaxID=1033252 RepID=A0AAD7N6S3_9AGAR|nr:hypothetical protein B0H16DRAFT_1461788 [Mycena metata]